MLIKMPPKARTGNPSASQQPRPVAHATSPTRGDSPAHSDGSSSPSTANNSTDLKSEILASLRNDIAGIFKTELHLALNDNLSSVKSELQAVKTELSNSIATIQSDVTSLKNTIGEMEHSLSACTDDVTKLQTKMEQLSSEICKLENKCEDLEARSRRNNIRIVGVPEDFADLSKPAAISTLLKDVFDLEKEPLLDRAHRTLQPKPKPGERPRAIVARLHYYNDCADILRRARIQKRIKIGDMAISVFPDHTTKTARAQALFNDVRRQLRGIPGIRFGLLYPARLRITNDGIEKEFKSPEDAKAYIKTLNK